MMQRLSEILLCLFVFAITSCGSDEKELTPSLGQEELIISEGEQAIITVNNANNVSAVASASNVSVNVSGNRVYITAVKAGECTVRVTADGYRLQCKVVVLDNSKAEEDEPSEPEDDYDFSAELQDATSRYVSSELALRYDDIGVAFMVENGNKITIQHLDNGEIVNFRFDGNVALGVLNNPQLSVNSNVVEIKHAEIKQLNASGMWILITTISNEHITIVLTDV